MLSDSDSGVVAGVERANSRVEYSLESQAKTIDALLNEWKENDLLRIWIPMVGAASMLIGLFAGIEIQCCRDTTPTATIMAMPAPAPAVTSPASGVKRVSGSESTRAQAEKGKRREYASAIEAFF